MRHAGPMPAIFEPAWVKEQLPRVLPASWRVVEWAMDGAAYDCDRGLRVILTGNVHGGKRWMHLSTSRASRVPDYDDLCGVKSLFLGDEALAVSLFVPRSRHINIHPYCLHMWRCLDGDPVPDFAEGGNTI